MLARVEGAYNPEFTSIPDYRKFYDNPDISVHGNCESVIGQDQIGLARNNNGNIVVGYDDSIEYKVDDRVRYENVLYRVLQNHTSQPNWTPVAAASLFAKVLIPDPDVIPDWEQPDSTNPYQIGDKVRFEGHVYESTINNNIWSPSAYPAGWKLIE